MRFFSILFLALVCQAATAQEQAEQQAINKDVWFNYMQSYQDLDAGLFLKLHSERAMLIDSLQTAPAAIDDCLEAFNRWNREGIQQRIAFSFLSREQNEDWAYESGIFKLSRYKNGKVSYFYGRFDISLHKVNGRWKLHFDPETDQIQSVGEEDFKEGRPLVD